MLQCLTLSCLVVLCLPLPLPSSPHAPCVPLPLPALQIVPRLVLEGSDLQLLLSDVRARRQAVSLIVRECREHRFDGIVLEAWSAWLASGILSVPELRVKVTRAIRGGYKECLS